MIQDPLAPSSREMTSIRHSSRICILYIYIYIYINANQGFRVSQTAPKTGVFESQKEMSLGIKKA